MARPTRNRLRSDTNPLQDVVRRLVNRLQTAPSTQAATWGLILVVAAAFGSGLGYPPVFGDYASLSADKLAGYGRSLPVPGTAWLAEASFGWTARLLGLDVSWHRFINLVLQITATIAAFALARRALREAPGGAVHSDWVALLAAALFALHPIAVFATAYLSARSVLLAGMFSAIAVWSVLKAGTGEGRGVWWLAPMACGAALLSSPAAVALPLALALAARLYAESPGRGRAWTAVLASSALVAAWLAWSLLSGDGVDFSAAGYFQYAAENSVRWLRGAAYAFVPLTGWMAIDMPEPTPAATAFMSIVIAFGCVLLFVAAFVVGARPRLRLPAFCLGCVAAFGIGQALHPGAWAGFTVWLAYPLLFYACATVAWMISRLRPRRMLAAGTLAAGIVAACGVATLQAFSSHVALWDDAIRVAQSGGGPQPHDARLYVNRGTLHRAEGHSLAAIADYSKALELQPDLPRALRGRAQAYVDDKRYGEALKDLQRLLDVEPKHPATHADIGLVLMQMGKLADALKSFDAAAEQGMREPRLFLNRGLARFRLGGLAAAPRALDDIERALSLDAGYALAHFNRGLIFEQAAYAGVRLRDAASPEIMRLVAAQNIGRACQLGHRPACDLAKARAEEKARLEAAAGGPAVVTPEALREQGLPALR